MEIGRLPEIDNAKANQVLKVEKVPEADPNAKIVPDEKYKNNQAKEPIENQNEVVLDNIKFGYNKSSKDFFVKVTRGDAEYKFPTEDMMKMKAHLMAELDSMLVNIKK